MLGTADDERDDGGRNFARVGWQTESVAYGGHVLVEAEPAAVTVYNKGDGPCGGGGARFAEVRCPNVGREGEAYLRHILDRYESLPTVTVFAQADITDHLAEENELRVRVWDPTDAGFQPRGKQVREPKGIWYTPVTGIWQTVWLEPVPRTRITALHALPDVGNERVRVLASTDGAWRGLEVRVDVIADGEAVASTTVAADEPAVIRAVPRDGRERRRDARVRVSPRASVFG